MLVRKKVPGGATSQKIMSLYLPKTAVAPAQKFAAGSHIPKKHVMFVRTKVTMGELLSGL